MGRLRSQDGFISYVATIAALAIVMLMTVALFKQIGPTGTGGAGGGAASDAAAQAEAQHAFAAAQRCAQAQGGSYSGCGVDQVIENEPTLAAARGHLVAAGNGAAAEVSSKSSTGNEFTISVANGVVSRTCTAAGQGTCPAAGRW